MNKQRFDIRIYKRNLRLHYKQIRTKMNLQLKAKKDAEILRLLLSMPEYQKAETVLCFVSVPPVEVDTHILIDTALAQGKRVAVPYCIDGTRNMQFYCIHSREQLVRRTFGVLEPVPEQCKLLTNMKHSVCILPGLAFDLNGYRLGYGGGYYDRFLSGQYKHGITIGICYQSCVRKSLVHGRFDVPCKYLITEGGIRTIVSFKSKKGKAPG